MNPGTSDLSRRSILQSAGVAALAALPKKSIHCCGGFTAALLFAMALPAGDVLAAPQGELDASFGQFGRLLVPGDGHSFSAVAQLHDGKILLGSGSALYRFNPDGSWDDSFGDNGTVRFDHFDYCFSPVDLAEQPDGNIVLAGTLGGEWCGPAVASLVRFHPDGTKDATFGVDGHVSFNLGDNPVNISRILVLDDGRILMGGTASGAGGSRLMFARFEADGTLDATFGTGPLAGTTLIDSNAPLGWMDRQGDGKFIACSATHSALRVVRLHANGSVDSTYGVDGVARIAMYRDGEFLSTHCVVMPDGSIVLAASVNVWGKFLELHRLTPEGARDTRFGTIGELSMSLGEDEKVATMDVLADGHIAISGSVTSQLMFIARIDPVMGQLDADFGDNGVTLVDFGDGQFSSRLVGGSLLQQADGFLLGVGYVIRSVGNQFWEPALAFARIRSDSTGHPGFAGFAAPARFQESSSEGLFEAIAVVRRTGGSTGTLSVDFDTIGDTAQAPRDFTATSGTLTWTAGDTEAKLVKIPINTPSSGTFWLELSNSTGGLATSRLHVTIGTAPLPPQPGGTGPGNRGGGGGAIDFWLLSLLMLAAAPAVLRSFTFTKAPDFLQIPSMAGRPWITAHSARAPVRSGRTNIPASRMEPS